MPDAVIIPIRPGIELEEGTSCLECTHAYYGQNGIFCTQLRDFVEDTGEFCALSDPLQAS
jgi:hypothetical protein